MKILARLLIYEFVAGPMSLFKQYHWTNFLNTALPVSLSKDFNLEAGRLQMDAEKNYSQEPHWGSDLIKSITYGTI